MIGSTFISEQTNHKKQWRLALAAGLAFSVLGISLGAAHAQTSDTDLRRGAVFAMSNARDGNEVAAFSRAPDGALTQVGSFPTGGTGSGSFEDSDNGLILGTIAGEIAPNNLIEPGNRQLPVTSLSTHPALLAKSCWFASPSTRYPMDRR